MKEFSRTWWGKRFITALEEFTDQARLGRGRSYARNGKILNYKIEKNIITATVRGSINPYFGVYKEPKYNTTIEISTISRDKWSKVIKQIASKASFVSKLMMNEVPDNIESVFSKEGTALLPHSKKELKTKCSCPDSANPCKHIAGVYYLVASQLDQNPFLLFELRGLSKDELQLELLKTPLGRILSDQINIKEYPIEKSLSFYTNPDKEDIDSFDLKEFWNGKKRLAQNLTTSSNANVSAILIKKQGDFPPFWKKDTSFVDVMEQIYNTIKTRNKNLL